MGTDGTLAAQALFVLSGVAQTLLAQVAFYQGGSGETTLLPLAANYFGMAAAVVFPRAAALAAGGGSAVGDDGAASAGSTAAGTDSDVESPLAHTAAAVAAASAASSSAEAGVSLGGLAGVVARAFPTMSGAAEKRVRILTVVDIAGNVFGLLGIIYAGSGLYQVVYSCVVVLAAVWGRVFLKRVLSTKHWLAVAAVTVGLAVSVIAPESVAKSHHGVVSPPPPSSSRVVVAEERGMDHAAEDSAEQAHRVVLGVLFSLGSTVLYSIHYTMSDALLSRADAPKPAALQARLGSYLAMIVAAYLMVYTLPNFDALVARPIEAAGGSMLAVAMAYVTLAGMAFLHQATFFRLVGSVGAVSTGILQGVRAVLVFGASHLFFCATHPEQCFSVAKGVSAVLVISAIIYFASLPPPRRPSVPAAAGQA